MPRPLCVVIPLPRYDIAEADEPLIHELLTRGHRVSVVTSPALETRYAFGVRGCRVWLTEPPRPGGGVTRALATLRGSLQLYRLAAQAIEPGSYVIAHSNDAVLIKPFVEAARRHRAQVAFVQMAYFHADVAGHYQGPVVRAWSRMPVARRALRHAEARIISALTGIPVYVGPRRVWGTCADICFMADDAQARNHINAGIPPDRFRVTGVPFMDMIWQRRQGFDDTARRAARAELGAHPSRRMLLVLTQNPENLVAGPLDRHAFIRDLMGAVTEAVTGWDVVFKLHPAELLGDYEDARRQTGCRVAVVGNFNIVMALLACDGMVSVDISSPCYYARELGVPQVIFRVRGSTLNDGHLPNFPHVPLVDSHIELARVLRGFAALGSLHHAGVTSSATMDGHASRRIVDELERLRA